MRPAAAQPGPDPGDTTRHEGAEYRAGGADQRDIAGAAITEPVPEPGAEGSAHQH